MPDDRCRTSGAPSSVIRQLLLEPERMTAVLVIVMVPAEFMIPGPAINLNGTVISFVNFKPQGSAFAPPRDLLCHREQGRRNPAACVFRGDCEGIESRDPAGSTKQHDGDAHDRAVRSGHHGDRAGRNEKPPQAAS